MKFKKRTMALMAFCLGAVVFTTAAAADTAIGSGYNNLKDAAKETTARLARDTDSFQVDLFYDVKIDGREVYKSEETAKVDQAGGRTESNSRIEDAGGEDNVSYSYTEPGRRIYKTDDMEKYYVNEYYQTNDVSSSAPYSDPFEQEYAADFERIMDAFVGSLKDAVQMEETGGRRMYIMSLSETQIPALANAVVSVAAKYSIMESHRFAELGIPEITSDIYVQEASGKAIENEDGLLEDVLASVSFSGRDKNGADHTASIELSMALSGINATEFSAPVVNEDNAEFTKVSDTTSWLSPKYVGTYKCDIVSEDGDTLQKVGEQVLTITKVDEKGAYGHFEERYADGVTPEGSSLSFNFEPAEDPRTNQYYSADTPVLCTDADGNTSYAMLSYNEGYGLRMQTNVEFLDDHSYASDGASMCFTRVFD